STGSGKLTAYSDMGETQAAEFEIKPESDWIKLTAELNIPDGVYPLYFIYKGTGLLDMMEIEFD
ncbi:MAG: hypothetical protein IJY74_04095, partial [Oscillospiraceae bacterium]|nr:hypothetical protein [Oscillospiraceae bacterium]